MKANLFDVNQKLLYFYHKKLNLDKINSIINHILRECYN